MMMDRMLDRSTVERQVLANGLVFLADTAVDNDIVALKLHLRLGSLYEEDGEAGLSACMARMLLRGAGARDAAELAMSIESLGVRLHTGVGNENGLVALVCPREVFDRGFEIALEVLTRPVFPQAELAVDIQMTLASIQSRLDHPLAHAVDLFDETYYAQHPFHKPAIGYTESVRAPTRAAVVEHWRRFVRPDNMVAGLGGRVDAGAVRARLAAALVNPVARGVRPPDGAER